MGSACRSSDRVRCWKSEKPCHYLAESEAMSVLLIHGERERSKDNAPISFRGLHGSRFHDEPPADFLISQILLTKPVRVSLCERMDVDEGEILAVEVCLYDKRSNRKRGVFYAWSEDRRFF
jgi:hypothetical protein